MRSGESLWNETNGARHSYLQCLIQVAVGLHHADNLNWTGARKLFASALEYLEKGRAAAEEVDVDELKDKVLDFELALQQHMKDVGVVLPFFELPLKA